MSRIEKDGNKWLRRPELCIKSCRAVLRRRSYHTDKAAKTQLNALTSKPDGHYVVGIMPHPLDPHPSDRVLAGSRNRYAYWKNNRSFAACQKSKPARLHPKRKVANF